MIVTVHYDVISADELVRLRTLLMAGRVRIEFDYDRVGWSKTGWIYRVYEAEKGLSCGEEK